MRGFSDGSVVKICLLIHRFDPWVGNISQEWQPLQYSCLENPMDREAWRATVHEVTKSRTLLSDSTTTLLGEDPLKQSLRQGFSWQWLMRRGLAGKTHWEPGKQPSKEVVSAEISSQPDSMETGSKWPLDSLGSDVGQPLAMGGHTFPAFPGSSWSLEKGCT